MNDFFIDLGLTALLALLTREIPTNGNTKSKWKRALLKLFKAIAVAYKDDPDFKFKV